MNRIINPYNVLPFYTEPLDEHSQCPLYASTYRLPPWQIPLDSYPSGSPTAYLHTLDGTQVTSMTTSVTSGTDGRTWFDYKGLTLGDTQNEGLYRIHATIEGTTYYSHVICLEEGFRLQDWTGALLTCTSGSGTYTFTFAFVLEPPNMATAIEADFGTGYRQIGVTSGQITQDDITGSGSVSVDLRFRVFYEGGDFYKQYRLSFDTSDPCGTDTYTATKTGGHAIDRYAFLEFENSTDLQSLGLFYQTGFIQRFYFKSNPRFPVPITEETFLRNGENDSVLESAAIAEQLNLDCYPVPDHLLTVLASVRYHDTVKLVSTMDGKETPIKNFSFAPRTTENDLCSIVTLQGEVNRVWLAGCQENVTLP